MGRERWSAGALDALASKRKGIDMSKGTQKKKKPGPHARAKAKAEAAAKAQQAKPATKHGELHAAAHSEGLIRELLKDGPASRADILEHLANEGIGEDAARKAVGTAYKSGALITSGAGKKDNRVFFALAGTGERSRLDEFARTQLEALKENAGEDDEDEDASEEGEKLEAPPPGATVIRELEQRLSNDNRTKATRYLPVRITDEQARAMRVEAALKLDEADAMAPEINAATREVDDCDARLKDAKKKLKELEEGREAIITAARSTNRHARVNTTYQDVECIEIQGFAEGWAYTFRVDDRAVIETRKIRREERQGSLFRPEDVKPASEVV